MKSVIVIPEYGYGWQREGQSIEVPPPFTLAVTRYERDDIQNVYEVIVGKILDSPHVLSGLWILISLRTREAMPTYNVSCYKVEPPFMNAGDIDPFCVPRVFDGFATLKL